MRTEKTSADAAGKIPDLEALLDSDLVRRVMEKMFSGLVDDGAAMDQILESAREIMKGKTFGQGFGLTPEKMSLIASLAAQQYLAANYGEALRLYSFMALMDHFDARALKGMAMCHQRLDGHQEALKCFGLSLLLKPEDLESVVMSAESLIHLARDDEAMEIIEKLLAIKDADQHAAGLPAIRVKARGLKDLLVRRMQEAKYSGSADEKSKRKIHA